MDSQTLAILQTLPCYKCQYRDSRACPYRTELGGYEASGCNQGKLDLSLIPEGASEYDIPEPPGWEA